MGFYGDYMRLNVHYKLPWGSHEVPKGTRTKVPWGVLGKTISHGTPWDPMGIPWDHHGVGM